TGYRITCSTRSSRFRTSLHAGSGRTIMNGQTWPWVVSRHDRSWPWWPDSTSEPRYKWGDYRSNARLEGKTKTWKFGSIPSLIVSLAPLVIDFIVSIFEFILYLISTRSTALFLAPTVKLGDW